VSSTVTVTELPLPPMLLSVVGPVLVRVIVSPHFKGGQLVPCQYVPMATVREESGLSTPHDPKAPVGLGLTVAMPEYL